MSEYASGIVNLKTDNRINIDIVHKSGLSYLAIDSSIIDFDQIQLAKSLTIDNRLSMYSIGDESISFKSIGEDFDFSKLKIMFKNENGFSENTSMADVVNVGSEFDLWVWIMIIAGVLVIIVGLVIFVVCCKKKSGKQENLKEGLLDDSAEKFAKSQCDYMSGHPPSNVKENSDC